MFLFISTSIYAVDFNQNEDILQILFDTSIHINIV